MALLGSSHSQQHRGQRGAQEIESCSLPPSPCALQLRAAVAGCSAVLSLPLLASAAAQGTAPLELPFGQPVNTWAVGRSSGSCEQLGCIPGRLWVKQWV